MWSELPQWEWRGPTVNQGGPMVEQRGVVIHIAEGYYEGTISWCRNPRSDVSAHFVVARDGRIAQLVRTDTTAWTQGKGNGHWLSIENEGFTLGHDLHQPGWERLSPQQLEANAAILAKAHTTYGVPLQLATSPSGRGLGHHSMGAENGVAWGHDDCPGPPIIAQKPAIVTTAASMVAPFPGDESDMRPYLLIKHSRYLHVFALFGNGGARWIGPAERNALLQQGVPQTTTTYDDEIARIADLAQVPTWPPTP